jgi:deoxyribose-phosphate aldolase
MSQITQGGRELAQYVDHTLLRPDATAADFEKLCTEAIEHGFFSVCLPPTYVSLAAKLLKKTNVKVCTVIGFPLGYSMPATKTFEAKTAIDHGADELDMVINVSALKSGDHSLVLDDIRSVVRAASGHTVKVILETCYLTDAEKTAACELALKAGAHFVKTSTGFGPSGATEADVALMARVTEGKIGVKASGGIRDFATAQKMISLGATRLGTSNGINIITAAAANTAATY